VSAMARCFLLRWVIAAGGGGGGVFQEISCLVDVFRPEEILAPGDDWRARYSSFNIVIK
jgi:hypothetical protein